MPKVISKAMEQQPQADLPLEQQLSGAVGCWYLLYQSAEVCDSKRSCSGKNLHSGPTYQSSRDHLINCQELQVIIALKSPYYISGCWIQNTKIQEWERMVLDSKDFFFPWASESAHSDVLLWAAARMKNIWLKFWKNKKPQKKPQATLQDIYT